MTADLSICGGRTSELSCFLLLCQKLASMEARLQRPRLDVDTSQICRLIGQTEHFLGDVFFCCSSCSSWQPSGSCFEYLTYSFIEARHSQIYEMSLSKPLSWQCTADRSRQIEVIPASHLVKARMLLSGTAFVGEPLGADQQTPSCLSHMVKRAESTHIQLHCWLSPVEHLGGRNTFICAAVL